jgi:hypothetical protein
MIVISFISIVICSCSTIPDVIQTEQGSIQKEHFLSLPEQTRLWNPMDRLEQYEKLPKTIRNYCPEPYSGYSTPYYEDYVELTGSNLRSYRSNTMYFIQTIYSNMSLYFNTLDSNILFLISKDLNKAAEADAFVKVRPWSPKSSYNRYNEPVFCQRNLLLALAFVSQAILDSPDIPIEFKNNIRQWGDSLLKATEKGLDQMTPGSGDDRRAQKAATLASWAVVTKNKEIFVKAMENYWMVASYLSSKGGHTSFVGPSVIPWIPSYLQLRYNNMVMGWLSMTAEAAEQNGIPLYSAQVNNTTLHDAIQWHVMASYHPIYQNRTKVKQVKQYLVKKHSPGSENFAWLESYAARFPERPITKIIKEIIKDPIYGGYFGGYTACIYRPLK